MPKRIWPDKVLQEIAMVMSCLAPFKMYEEALIYPRPTGVETMALRSKNAPLLLLQGTPSYLQPLVTVLLREEALL